MNARALRASLVTGGPSAGVDLFALVSLVRLVSRARRRDGRRRITPAMAIGASLPFIYLALLRPWHLRWGTTPGEPAATLPGDERIPDPIWRATRAVNIAAPPSEVWPWLLQMGQDKAGLYSYDALENLAGLEFHNADRVHPEWQKLEVGDLVRAGPKVLGLDVGWRVAELEEERALVLELRNEVMHFVWSFVLEPIAGGTRLVLRSQLDAPRRRLFWLQDVLLIEFPHFVMERAQLLGIKKRVERAQPAFAS